jgi:hypothetical protein
MKYKLGPGETPVVDERAKIRAATRAANEKLRKQMEAGEVARPHDREFPYGVPENHPLVAGAVSDEGDVEPRAGYDTGYDLDFGERGQKGSPSSAPEADLNPSQKPESVAAKRAKQAAKKRKAK